MRNQSPPSLLCEVAFLKSRKEIVDIWKGRLERFFCIQTKCLWGQLWVWRTLGFLSLWNSPNSKWGLLNLFPESKCHCAQCKICKCVCVFQLSLQTFLYVYTYLFVLRLTFTGLPESSPLNLCLLKAQYLHPAAHTLLFPGESREILSILFFFDLRSKKIKVLSVS